MSTITFVFRLRMTTCAPITARRYSAGSGGNCRSSSAGQGSIRFCTGGSVGVLVFLTFSPQLKPGDSYGSEAHDALAASADCLFDAESYDRPLPRLLADARCPDAGRAIPLAANYITGCTLTPCLKAGACAHSLVMPFSFAVALAVALRESRTREERRRQNPGKAKLQKT